MTEKNLSHLLWLRGLTDVADPRAELDLETFEALRPELTSVAYRLLGELSRAEDIVQEAWLRWSGRGVEAHTPKAFLITTVTRLCLNELGSAHARREHARGDRLPEPVDLTLCGMDLLQDVEQLSMALLVLLERLSPAERAVLILHDAFDFTHDEITPLVAKTPAACRKLLERARSKVAAGRRASSVPREEHQRLLQAFVGAVSSGDLQQVVQLLAEDATLITDGGAEGRSVGGLQNLRQPLQGAQRVAAFILATSQSARPSLVQRDLNGQPGLVLYRAGEVFAALSLEVFNGRIEYVFFHADRRRLGHVH